MNTAAATEQSAFVTSVGVGRIVQQLSIALLLVVAGNMEYAR